MRALVTGGAGFIGSHIADRLLADGHEVVVLDDLSSGHVSNLAAGVRFVEGSMLDPEALSNAVEGCELVFHEAAHRAVFRSVEHPLESNDANVTGTLWVLEAARQAGARRVVLASSSSVYGGSLTLPTPESAPLMPRSPYAVAKMTGEHYARVYYELYGLETVSLRYFNVFGPRMRADSQYALVVPLFVEALTTGAPPQIHGDGLQSRDFTYIDDVVDANIAAAMSPAENCSGKAYNIGQGGSHSILELLDTIAELLGVDYEAEYTDTRPGDVRQTCADPTAAARDLDHRCVTDFREGMERMLSEVLVAG